jgi:hypothetical protein
MGRPIKKTKRDAAAKGLSIKSPDVLRLLRARSSETGLGYTELLRRVLARPLVRSAAEIARIETETAAIQRRMADKRAEFAAAGKPWPSGDHDDLYDEHGLPK